MTLTLLALTLSAANAVQPQSFIEIAPAITKRSVQARSGKIDYTATASQIPLRSAEGEVEARMFYVAYTKDVADNTKRPVTFCFNGGPGSATIWLHMGGLGPVMAPLNDDGTMPKPPFRAINNPDTWLEFTDLVFIDAPGTGFSRLTKPDFARKYFGVRPDITAFTNFIKTWLAEHQRWSSPLFVAGESYGGIRGSGLCARLFDQGVAVNGFISISGTNSYMTLDGMRGNDIPYIGFFPSLAATAWYHGKLNKKYKTVESVVDEATKWVEDDYTRILMKGDSLTDAEKEKAASKMSELLGIAKEYCLGSNLRVGEFAFFKELLRDKGLAVGRLDSRIVGKEETKTGGQQSGDASSDAITSPYFASLRDYLSRDLGVKTTMDYNIFGSVRPWTESEGSYSETGSDLRGLLAANKHFRVLYACGYYDLACPFYATIFSVNHMGLDQETRKQISYTYYPAGHMMYIEKGSRTKLTDDVRKFVADSL